VNIVTDAACWLRNRLRLTGTVRISRSTRYWLLAVVLLTSAATGVTAWELVNPVSTLHRGIIFGMGAGWALIAGVFIFDVAVKRHGWCGHVCPMGAFYSLLAIVTPLRVSAANRAACNDCMDCYRVCPEPQVIKPALKGADKGNPPLILAPACTNCGRCMDVCTQDVFRFTNRFAGHPETPIVKELET
jgi:ferredoxin-type protein NapH